MKNLLVLSMALVALFVIGCSDQSSSVGPLSNDNPVLSKAVPPTTDEGMINVDETIMSDDLSYQYSAKGNISYVRSFDGKWTNLTTDVKIVLADIIGQTDGSQVVAGRATMAIGNSPEVVSRLPLDESLAGYDLELTYSVGADVRLKSISIVPSPRVDFVAAKPAPQREEATIVVDQMVATDDDPTAYRAKGEVRYSRSVGGNTFATVTKIVLTGSNGVFTQERYLIAGEHSFALESPEQIVASRFPLNGRMSGFDLEIRYLVGKGVQLMGVAIVPSVGPSPIVDVK